MWRKAGAMLALLFSAALLLAACAPDAAPPTAIPTPTPEVVVIVVTPEPTPNLEATVAAMVATAQPTPSATPQPTDTPHPTPTTPPPPTVDIPATVAAELTRVAPAPTPTPSKAARSVSDIVKSIDGGLVQIATPTGDGSGFVVSEDGLIVTNAHVVEQHTSVTVRFVNGRSYTGQVLGRDETIDLAVVKVESRQALHPMTLGDASSIGVGDAVIALGFPLGDELGRDYTVTTGVVSSRRTDGTVERIQTDAAINPGNSGGPLVNRNGRVIGVNTSSYTHYQGISFAVSVSEVKENLDFLASGGIVLADAGGEWWTYENENCRYSLLMHPNWILADESRVCDAHFERYEGNDLVGSVIVWVYTLESGETLRDFAEWYRDDIIESARNWEIFEIRSFDTSETHDGYVIDYVWQETDEYCTESARDLIVESSYFRDALVFSSSMCRFMPQSAFDEIGTMEFDY